VIDGLRDQGVFAPVMLPPQPVVPAPIPITTRRSWRPISWLPPTCCARRWPKGGFGVTLLDGVTGSGKTEVYFEAIAETIRRGTAGSHPVAGDRADQRSSSTGFTTGSGRGRRNGIPSWRRGPAKRSGGR
jgi:hypothetical protein